MSYCSSLTDLPDWDDSDIMTDAQNVKLDLHLSSPIRNTFDLLFLDAIKIYPGKRYKPDLSSNVISYCELPSSVVGPARELIAILGSQKEALKLVVSDPFLVAHDVYNQLHNSSHRKSVWLPDKSKMLSKVLHEIITCYDSRLLDEFDDPTGATWPFNEIETGLYVLKTFFEDIRDAICKLAEKRHDHWEIYPFPSDVYPLVVVSRSMCAFISGDKIKSKDFYLSCKVTYGILAGRFKSLTSVNLVNYEFLLCMQDTITSRLFTLYSQRLLCAKFPFRVAPDTIKKTYKIFDQSMGTKKNDIYKQVKLFEALISAHVILKTNKVSMKHDFINYLERTAAEDGFSEALEMSDHLRSLGELEIIELMGMFRHWGHPIVDEAGGCEKVKKIIRTRGPVDEAIMTDILGALNRQFIFEFISQMKRWPSCNTKKLDDNSLLKSMIDKNTRYINEYGNSIPLKEWALVTITNELEFDYSIDYLDLVSDKAIASLLSERSYSYNPAISGMRRAGKPTTHRRLITEILDRKTINIKEICNIIRSRAVPEEWCNIKLASKEKELNPIPRLFAMMVMEMRLAYCVMEKNIAKKVFHFYPQQSMNMGEDKLFRRLSNIATPRDDKTTIELIIGIDFTSWNIHWSMFNTERVAAMVSQLFGLPGLYEYCHEFFSISDVSLSSSLLVPEQFMNQERPHLILPEEMYAWKNHLGGLEGICQKLWTLITIGVLLVVESRTGIKAAIIGQGDNQVCKIQVPLVNLSYSNEDEKYELNDEHIRSVHKKFMDVLTEIAEGIGLKLKALESWVSDSSAQYSKDWVLRGAFQSQMIKRINRMMPDVSEDYKTFVNRVSSLQSAGFSSAQKSYVMALPWFVSQIETGLTLLRDINATHKGSLKNLLNVIETESFFRFFYLSDNSFTGVPLVNLGEYEFRGHPDPLCTYLSVLERLITSQAATTRVQNISKKIWAWLARRKYPIGPASPELLISNPTSVNIETPNPINYLFKQLVYTGLQDTARNEDIKDMFNAVAPAYDKWFYQYLISARPCYPRLLNLIMTHSPTGARLYTIGKLVNSKTVNRVIHHGVRTSLEDQIEQIDQQFYVHLYNTYRSIVDTKDVDTYMCPTQLADDIRAYTFKDLMKGDPIVGVTVPHPMHTIKFEYEDNTPDVDGYISVLAPEPFSLQKLFTKGNQPPFVGTKTIEKVSGKVVTVSGKSRPFDDVCRLIQMLGWAVDENSKFGDFIKDLVKSRTNVPFEILVGMSGRNYFGSHIHRTADPATKKDVRGNMRHSVTTHLAYSSDRLGITTRGGDDYNLQPSALFLYATREILKEIIHTEGTFRYVRGYLRNHSCCLEAYDNLPARTDIEGDPPLISSKNPLLYADITDFQTLVIPESCLVHYCDTIPSADAVGYYLMSRYKGIILTAILSYQEIKPPYLTRVSMSEVINIGIRRIICSFAKYLYLYLESDYASLRLNLSAMGPEVWCGICELCLIPDVLPQLCQDLESDGTPDVFKCNNQVNRLLNELLIREMDKIARSTDRSHVMKSTRFFVLDTVKFPHVLRMWWESICISYAVDPQTRLGIFNIIKNMSKNKGSWGEAMGQIVEKLQSDLTNADLFNYIIQHHRIKLMKQPPEFYFRTDKNPSCDEEQEQRIECQVPPDIIKVLEELKLPIDDYTAPVHDEITQLVSLDEMLVGDRVDPPRIKLRTDQSGRLRGNLSTAWCKYIQLIIKYKLPIHRPAICTADGESSVGIAISRYSGGQPVYYNSLQSRDIVTQRYEGFVPGSFICDRDRVKGQDLSLIYGGDLTDHYYLSKFLQILPEHPSILTCDAETSGEFDPRVRLSIINSLLVIMREKKPESCIIKDFMGNLKLLAATISAIQQHYYVVSIAVPHYSSFESLECFIVARGLRLSDVPPVESSGLRVSRNYLVHVPMLAIMKHSKLKAVKPFAYNSNVVCLFAYLGDKLGFHSNLSNALYRVTSIYPPTLSIESLPSWLRDCRAIVHGNLISLCKTFGYMQRGRAEISAWEGAQIAMNPSSSRLMEQYSFTLFTLDLLQRMLSAGDMESAQQELTDALSSSDTCITVGESIIYRLSHKDIAAWSKQHLKPLWRIWGHHYYRP